jgi:hypothetical protein
MPGAIEQVGELLGVPGHRQSEGACPARDGAGTRQPPGRCGPAGRRVVLYVVFAREAERCLPFAFLSQSAEAALYPSCHFKVGPSVGPQGKTEGMAAKLEEGKT